MTCNFRWGRGMGLEYLWRGLFNRNRMRITITGQPPSKSNCYKVVTIKGHGALAKTSALKAYEQSFYMQCPLRGRKIARRFRLIVDVFFKSDRPDLDNALKAILDCLQGCEAIKNDRLCTEIRARKFIDKNNPRIEFEILEESY